MSDQYEPLSENEQKLLKRLFSSPDQFPKEFWSAIKKKIEADPPNLSLSDISQGKTTTSGITMPGAGAASNQIQWLRQSDGSVVAATEVAGGLADNAQLGIYTRANGTVANSLASLQARYWDSSVERTAATLQANHYGSGGGSLNETKATAVNFSTPSTLWEATLINGNGLSSFILDHNNKVRRTSGYIDACQGYWTVASFTADSNHRVWTASLGGTIFDNGAYVAGSAMLAADGTVYARTAGWYLFSQHIAPYNGTGGTGYYAGGRLVKNNSSDVDFAHVSAAMLQPVDGTVGGVSGVGLQQLAAGDFVRSQAWSASGIGLRISITAIRLPI